MTTATKKGLACAALMLTTALTVNAQTNYDYRVLATTKTATLEKELREAGAAGYEGRGITVSKTAMGGKELVAITRRAK